MSVTATAPGKLMLLGEHAVVYDQPCLVTTVDLRYTATVEHTEASEVRISTPQLDAERVVPLDVVGEDVPRETAFVEAVIARFRNAFGVDGGIQLTTDGPTLSYGLGSSSAVTVATAAALASLHQVTLEPRALFDLCYGAVLDVQGSGSGYDVASAVYGGTLYYRRVDRTIEPLDVATLPLVVGYSGSKVGTVGLVQSVRDRRARFPGLVDALFATAGDAVETARDAIAIGDWATFGEIADIAQGVTDGLGVNTGRLSRLVYAARDAGALGAKLSGAGGGDCMFAVAPAERRDAVEAALTAAEAEIVRLPLGGAGVRIEP
ncbi:MAG: mevalonate kinase [Chloroflexota bacterium]